MRLIHHDDARNAAPDDILYDDTFEIDGHKVYIEMWPTERERTGLMEPIVDDSGDSLKALIEAVESPRGLAILDKTRPDIMRIYDILIQNTVVAWELPSSSGVVPCTPENMSKLDIAVKAEISAKIIEVSRQWIMAA